MIDFEVRMEFKEKVYRARMQLGLTQIELARQLGIGYATINRWENGVTHSHNFVLRMMSQLTMRMRSRNENNKLI